MEIDLSTGFERPDSIHTHEKSNFKCEECKATKMKGTQRRKKLYEEWWMFDIENACSKIYYIFWKQWAAARRLAMKNWIYNAKWKFPKRIWPKYAVIVQRYSILLPVWFVCDVMNGAEIMGRKWNYIYISIQNGLAAIINLIVFLSLRGKLSISLNSWHQIRNMQPRKYCNIFAHIFSIREGKLYWNYK